MCVQPSASQTATDCLPVVMTGGQLRNRVVSGVERRPIVADLPLLQAQKLPRAPSARDGGPTSRVSIGICGRLPRPMALENPIVPAQRRGASLMKAARVSRVFRQQSFSRAGSTTWVRCWAYWLFLGEQAPQERKRGLWWRVNDRNTTPTRLAIAHGKFTRRVEWPASSQRE